MDIAIVGYGIAGISAAVRFRRLGHRISHFERSKPPIAIGAGMLMHPAAQRQLQQLGILSDAMACGSPVRRLCAQTARGRSIMDFEYTGVSGGQCGLGIQRATLHRLLAHADAGNNHVRAGRTITSLDPHRGYLFEGPDVRHGPHDLLVIADGASSLLRDQLELPLRRNQRACSAALVGLVDDPDRLAGDTLVQYFDGARHLSVWPVGTAEPGGPPRCSIAMNVTVAEARAVRDSGIWRKFVKRLCPAVGRLLKDPIENKDLHIFSYRDVELCQCVVGRAVLLGDAAHSMSPQLGNGARLAMEDAAIVSTLVSQNDELSVALRAYALTRPQQVSQYHRASRWLTPLFQSDNRALAMLRDNLLASAMQMPSVQLLARTLFG